MKKINVTAVSCQILSLSFLVDFQELGSNLNIKLDIPSACARKLSEGKADIV